MKIPLVTDLSYKDKKVLLRVDFNVPLSQEGAIEDDSRIRASLPTIRYLLAQGAQSLRLMSHLGRPKGVDPHLSLKPCAERLSELLGEAVSLAPHCIGPAVESMAEKIVLLENLRFHPGEEDPRKDPQFAASLARLGDVYINDAFGAAHRAHASITEVPKLFPGKAAAGFLMAKEVSHLSLLLEKPDRPFCAILGGSKVSSKIGVIESLLQRVDALYLGGALSIPFLQAQGISVGASLVSSEEVAIATLRDKIELPLDFVASSCFGAGGDIQVVQVEEGIPDGWYAMDIGPRTIQAWTLQLARAKTVFWNGPLGVFEIDPFGQGTLAIAKALASSSAQTTIGGGDSLAAIHQMGLQDRFAYLSTGGGASLEFLEKGSLPGVEVLCHL